MEPYAIDFFVQLERQIWDALVAGDAAADARLLADDFLCVHAEGFAGKADHVGQLKAGPVVADYSLSEARLLILAPDVVLLAYRVDWRPLDNDRSRTMTISSIWSRSEGAWRNVFSQDSMAPLEGVP
ncbi:MAG: DUF4440 domain-containing protein [Acidobacteriota bacterium]